MFLGILISVDGYMNLHLANTEEYIDGTNTGALGEVLIRFIPQF
jgi:small nuclear ribonucleoprotein F